MPSASSHRTGARQADSSSPEFPERPRLRNRLELALIRVELQDRFWRRGMCRPFQIASRFGFSFQKLGRGVRFLFRSPRSRSAAGLRREVPPAEAWLPRFPVAPSDDFAGGGMRLEICG